MYVLPIGKGPGQGKQAPRIDDTVGLGRPAE